MDTLTQIALGTAIAQAGFSQKLGKKALLVGAFGGLLPDLDFFLTLGGDHFSYMETHRGWSHSIIVLPFVAFLMAWLSMKWGIWDTRKMGEDKPSHVDHYWTWYLLCFLALITHPLLDLCTSYGTQILTPLSNARFTLDTVSIIDLIYTVPLLIAIIVGLFSFKKPQRAFVWAKYALVFSTLYLCLGFFNSWDAKKQATIQLKEQNFAFVDVHVSPTMLNNVLWRVVAKDKDDRFAVGFFSTIARKTIQFKIYESDNDKFVKAVNDSKEGKILRWFSMNMLRAQTQKIQNEKQEVILTDMRFGLVSQPAGSFFNGHFEFDKNDGLVRAYIPEGNREDLKPSMEINAILSKIKGDT